VLYIIVKYCEEKVKKVNHREENQQWYNDELETGYSEGDLVECQIAAFQHANGVLSLVCALA
jgi:hypothetical protein